MTLDNRILDFLDGSLPHDDEAELLHTLSVSPEKRDVLRGFISQRSILAQDAKLLSVPFEAEQRLWERMGTVLPAASEDTSVALVPVQVPSGLANTAGFFARTFSGISSAVSACALVAGLGIGYFAGHTQTVSPAASNVVATNSQQKSYQTYASNRTYVPQQNLKGLPTPPLPRLTPMPSASMGTLLQIPQASIPQNEPPIISEVPVANAPAIAMARIGGDGQQPILHRIANENKIDPSFLSRFELRVDESFGRQFPNSTATNVSLPIITNSSISTFFQVFPHSNLLWAGASYGSANVTVKDLYAKPGDPTDPQQEELAGDTAHSQTTYVAALAELRLPAFATTDVTFTGGYGLATLGQMMFGEIGLHYSMSSQAGIECGLRVLRFSYDLAAEERAVINSGSSSLAVSNAVAASNPSFNVEFNAGLFFHF